MISDWKHEWVFFAAHPVAAIGLLLYILGRETNLLFLEWLGIAVWAIPLMAATIGSIALARLEGNLEVLIVTATSMGSLGFLLCTLGLDHRSSMLTGIGAALCTAIVSIYILYILFLIIAHYWDRPESSDDGPSPEE